MGHRCTAWSFYVFVIYFKISLIPDQLQGFGSIGSEILSK